jgi:hypothetical protein
LPMGSSLMKNWELDQIKIKCIRINSVRRTHNGGSF